VRVLGRDGGSAGRAIGTTDAGVLMLAGPAAGDLVRATCRQLVHARPTTLSTRCAREFGDLRSRLRTSTRLVELLHLGDGHTDGEFVAVLSDTDVVYARDLIEESAHPAYDNDCSPLAWPDTLDRLAGLLGEQSRVVPGHGVIVDMAYVEDQKAELGTVANTISGPHHNGVPLDDTLRHSEDWPYPVEDLDDAIRRGYEQLGPRSLPLA
jgi:hypothetical protein